MFKKRFHNLGSLNIGPRVLAIMLAITLATGAVGCGRQNNTDTPVVNQETQTQEQQTSEQPKEEQKPQTDDVISDVETNSEPEEQSDKKNFWSNLVNVITGNDKESEEDENKAPWYAPKHYLVQFETNGGGEINDKVVAAGTKISDFPTPNKENSIFLGWYYDKKLTEPVASSDQVWEKTKLYASYIEQEPLETLETVSFASAVDVQKDFTIKVTTTEDMTADAVKAAITADNLTNPDMQDFIQVSGSGKEFVISGIKTSAVDDTIAPGFDEGSTYRIALTDERILFDGQPETAREYNFTTAKEEVLNLTLDKDIKFIHINELNNIINSGEMVETLNLALYEADMNGKLGPADITTGSFEYNGTTPIQKGDIISIYDGLHPQARDLSTKEEDLGDIAYVEITEISGNTYNYVSAQPEDVIFEPDMLPVPVGADLDNSSATITVEDKYFDYSADVYANIELDSQTTVDPGDFFIFYEGDFNKISEVQLKGYGAITSVTKNNDGTTTVAYKDVTWEEVDSSMDVYTQNEIDSDELLEGVNTEAMEAEIEQQAIDSGFAEEAAQYLSSLALSTENFSKLSDNLNLEDYKVVLEDGTPVTPEELQLMADGVWVEVLYTNVKASVSKTPSHLGKVDGTEADKEGLAISLEVETAMGIEQAGEAGRLEITVSGKFIEEVGFDYGASSDTVWDVWGIIPYISEYVVTANIDVINYTGLEINAVMVTAGDKDDEVIGADIAKEIKELLKKNTERDTGDEHHTQLIEKYSELVSTDTDWIKIAEINIAKYNKGLPPSIPIIALEASVDFVIQMDASVSIGFEFEYLEGKRYTFSVSVFEGSVKADTITLLEKQYELCFYALGRIGVRAGIEMSFKIGLFSTKIANVGFEAGAGPYTKLWGYFYYELRYAESQGRSQQYSGAMLIDVGIYFNLALKAEAVGGRYVASVDLVDEEWSLWEAGRRDNVLDFHTSQEEMPEIILKQHVRSAQFGDDVFNMDYLDLVTGEGKNAIYSDTYDPERPETVLNRKNYIFTMTNDKFSYDPATNTIKVTPDANDKKLEGEMIITWINAPMSFSSKPLQRTITLYWDNLRDGYVIVPHTNGGTYIPMIVKKFEAPLTAPQNPEKLGYVFDGWFSDEELTVPYVFPEKMPDLDIDIYANWAPATNTPYTVEHYQENLYSGEYDLVETENFTGTTDTSVTPDVKTYIGFDSPVAKEVKILPDGSATLRYYYSLQRHTIDFRAGEANGENIVYDLKYGASVVAPQVAAKGYTFVGWSLDGTSIVEPVTSVGTEDLIYTALWTKDPDTAYRVEYYVQQPDGSYQLQHLIEEKTFTGTVLTAEELRAKEIESGISADEAYVVENGTQFENMTMKGVASDTATVEGNGKTVIKINYGRAKYNMTFDLAYESATNISKPLFYGETVSVPQNLVRPGYQFAGWSLDGKTAVTPITKMGMEDTTYIALWDANEYTVTFDKAVDRATGTMETMRFTYDEAQKLAANAFTNASYDFAGWATQVGGNVTYTDTAEVKNLTETKNGNVILYAVWTPTNYSISYKNVDKATHTNPTGYTVESENILLTDAVRAGYTFGGWYTNASFSGTAITKIAKGSSGNKTYYAKWIANTNTAYTVEHYKQQLDGSYLLADVDSLTGTTDTTVTPEIKSYTGFTSPATATVNIAADGSTVVKYNYTRKSYTLTFDVNSGAFVNGEANSITALYEASITLPKPEKNGYGFEGWFVNDSKFESATMPAENLTLTANWAAGKYSYTINYYQQNIGGGNDLVHNYTLAETVSGTGEMDQTLKAEVKSYTGFTSPKAQSITIGTKENVINYYYTRNQYSLNWKFEGGTVTGDYTNGDVYYDAPIVAPVLTKTGYSYIWNPAVASTMPANNETYAAVWTPNNYNISFAVNGGTTSDADLIQVRTIAFDSEYGKLAELTKPGYTFNGWFTAETGGTQVTAKTVHTVATDITLYAQYTPITYSISYENLDGATNANANPETYSIENCPITLSAPTKKGYTFVGWYVDEALEDVITTIPEGSFGDKTFYAKWTENTYKVIFHFNNGQDATMEQIFSYTEKKALTLKPADAILPAYTFLGWTTDSTETKAIEFLDGQEVEKLSATNKAEVHFYAVWTETLYNIVYENLEGATNDASNPSNFHINNNEFVLQDPAKPGYTFAGWYTDSTFTNKVEGSIKLEDYREWIFYAKWEANLYVIRLDSNYGVEPPTDTILMTYDVPANLTLLETIKDFENYGYTFVGWSTVKDGPVVYADGELVTNLVPEGAITLYAKWQLNVFNITYNLGVGSNANHSSNVASYSFEDDDITLYAPVAKTNYKFLGWYDAATGERITEIVKGEQRDISVTAKWAHGGTFTISYTSSKDVSGGRELTYTITRTIPTGAEATTNPQIIYVRTANGTAYGNTPEAATATGQDKYHFVHTDSNKEGSGKVTFSQTDLKKTITIKEYDDYSADYMAASYRIGSIKRYYYVQLYKIVDQVGDCKGTISSTTPLKRTMPLSAYELTTNFYRWFTKTIVGGSAKTVNDGGFDANPSYTQKPATIYESGASTAEELYRNCMSSNYGYRVTYDLKENNDGYQYFRLSTVDPDGKTTIRGDYIFATKDGEKASDWGRNIHFPNMGTGKQGDILFNVGKCKVNETYTMYNDNSTKYAVIGKANSVKMQFDAGGDNDDDWQFRNLIMHVKVNDKSKPAQQGMAPLALTDYAANETIYLTVVYNEVIKSASSIGFTIPSVLPIKNVTYVDGAGTNALTFKATVTKAFTVTPNVNNTIVNNTKPVTGTVKDILGN